MRAIYVRCCAAHREIQQQLQNNSVANSFTENGLQYILARVLMSAYDNTPSICILPPVASVPPGDPKPP